MTPEEFRTAGHALIDWIADLRAGIDARPVLAQVSPGEVGGSFDAAPPISVQSFQALLGDLESKILPGVTQVQHPMHFGWFPSNASLASVLGDLASSGIGSLGISWESSPALTEVEQVVCDWMRQLVGLSDDWSGTIHDSASTACLVALLIARERATDFVQYRGGTQSVDRPLVVYTTVHAHSSVAKAALLAGFGSEHVRVVDVDPATHAMDPTALESIMAHDVDDGLLPVAVVATVGTTATTAIDPVAAIATVAKARGVYVHVDAAMAGAAMLLPECRHLWSGVEGADSLCWNPHKWMGTVLDCSLFYVRDPGTLTRVMSTDPSYLQSAADGQVPQYRDWGIPLGRRFRALKLLFHLRLDGVVAIQDRLRRDLANAAWLEAQVSATDGWEICAPVRLQTVCVRHRPVDESGRPLAGSALDRHTLAWARRVNLSGDAYVTPSILDDEWMVRISIGVETTERVHVERLWQILQDAVTG